MKTVEKVPSGECWVMIVFEVTFALAVGIGYALSKDFWEKALLCTAGIAELIVMSWTVIHLYQQCLKLYYEFRKAEEEAKSQECKLTSKLLDLIRSHSARSNCHDLESSSIELLAKSTTINLMTEIHFNKGENK